LFSVAAGIKALVFNCHQKKVFFDSTWHEQSELDRFAFELWNAQRPIPSNAMFMSAIKRTTNFD